MFRFSGTALQSYQGSLGRELSGFGLVGLVHSNYCDYYYCNSDTSANQTYTAMNKLSLETKKMKKKKKTNNFYSDFHS